MRVKRWIIYACIGVMLLTSCKRADKPPLDTAGTTKGTVTTTTTATTTVTATAQTTSVATSFEPRECQLDVTLNGQTTRLSFSKETEYKETALQKHTLYVYEGITSDGVPITCEVFPTQNQIHAVTCDLPYEKGKITKTEVCTFLLAALDSMGFVGLTEDDLSVNVFAHKGFVGSYFASFSVRVSPKDQISGEVRLSSQKLMFARLRIGDADPFLSEYFCPYVTPDWV